MGTKNNPNLNDCYARALPDEPMFVLLARDLSAPEVVRDWAEIREVEVEDGIRPEEDRAVIAEARELADAMEEWRAQNDGAWRTDTENADLWKGPAYEYGVTWGPSSAGDGVYRRRPSHVTAFQVTQDLASKPFEEWPEWAGSLLESATEENAKAVVGWWFVRDEAGNIFTVSDDVFNATFDRVR